MYLSACITTRNRVQELEKCLEAIWNSEVKPYSVIVSDDSSDVTIQQKNQNTVSRYPGTNYIKGPQNGVCGNRNNAVNTVQHSEYVVFLDDDICIPQDFIGNALSHYQNMSPEQQRKTILSGTCYDESGGELVSTKLTFRGHFQIVDKPENVVVNSAVFPRAFFSEEQWDENIFFGYEDAELCLRLKKRGYKIQYCQDLRVLHNCPGKGTLYIPKIGDLTDYEIYIEAARLYIGIKRYKSIFPNPLKLSLFMGIYFPHMIVFLLRKHALTALPLILARSKFEYAWNQRGVP